MAYIFILPTFIIATLLAVTKGHDSSALSFELPDNEKQCFYQKFKEAKRMVFAYEVLKGGQNDVDLIIESPNGKEIYKAVKSTKDIVNFESSFGVYSFCFSNEFSTFTHKVVYFELRPEGHETLSDIAGQKKPSANTQIEETMDHIFRNSRAVQVTQTAYRLIEAKGRYVAESLGARVQLWSIGEALIIMCMGFGQVMILKRFFTHPVRQAGPKRDGEVVKGVGHGEQALRA